MTRETILKITEPEELFPSSDAAECQKMFRAFALEWHPDKHLDDKEDARQAQEVFSHINSLYDQVLEKIIRGTWSRPFFFEAPLRTGKKFSFSFKRKFPFELGMTYIGEDHVTYVVEAKNETFVRNYESATGRFTYGSDRMRAEVERYLPNPTFERLADGRHIVAVPKTPDLLRLRDVLSFYKGMIDAKHVAWIGSSLHNLCCYFSYAGIVHNDISLDTYFISPQYHSGALLGGWWYAVPKGGKLSQVPRRTFDLLPSEVRIEKKATVKIDLELTRAIGRELLDHPLSTSPKPLQNWFKSISSEEPVEEYRKWKETLEESFGVRRFTKMDVTSEEVYS